jgi:quercetin dioxygenase-like cupin family protein
MSTHLTERTQSQIPKAALASHTLLFDDARTRITQWVFAPGDQTGWHRHEWDYVTVQQSGGRLRLENADGSENYVDYRPGRTMAWTAPIEHNATNVSDEDVRVLEIEYKR